MKKKIFAVVLLIFTIGLNFVQKKSDVNLSDLALENVEALASDEDTSGSNDKYINDHILSTEFGESGAVKWMKTNYDRSCTVGGSQYCTPGPWSDYVYSYV